MEELESGNYIFDNFVKRVRKGIEAHLPNIADDIKSIVDSESQTDRRLEDNSVLWLGA